jgi:exopolysaccharide production protein ExoY
MARTARDNGAIAGASVDAATTVRQFRPVPRSTTVQRAVRPPVAAPALGAVALGVTDLLVAGFALVIAHLVARAWGAEPVPTAPGLPSFDAVALFLVIGTTLVVGVRLLRLYGHPQQSALGETYGIAKIVTLATVIGAASTLVYRDAPLPVPMLVCFWALGSIAIATVHAIYRDIVVRIYGRDPRPALKLTLVEPSMRPLMQPTDRALVIGSQLAVLSVVEPEHGDWPYDSWWQMKRDMDIALAAVLLLVAAPVMLIIAAAIRWTSPGAAIFRQVRIGRNARPFRIWKFRTMRGDAEAVLRADAALYAEYVANDYKLPPDRDPRITPLGRWLRRTSLDELPQLINVLRGEMSLVGPRPIVTDEIAHYGDHADTFHAALPGLTGAWQVAGRSDLRYPERCDVELEYVRNWSLARDLMILLATVRLVISGRGAM